MIIIDEFYEKRTAYILEYIKNETTNFSQPFLITLSLS